ncbi:exonuclease domain-containing protein [Thiolapillus sp.]|uniref:exonuclease domain-containing protein n=1 Tax=Thiolapillus sp. TaxID=2017437 RepID=UPI003AF56ED9
MDSRTKVKSNGMNKRQIFIDTETTGLSPNNGHRIVEIAAIETVSVSGTMHSTTSSLIIALRMSPSPDCCVVMEPFASTIPARPTLESRASMCCSQA